MCIGYRRKKWNRQIDFKFQPSMLLRSFPTNAPSRKAKNPFHPDQSLGKKSWATILGEGQL